MTNHDHESYEHLLMRAVDGVLSEDERARFEAHLAVCSPCREEYADFRVIKEDTDMLTRRILDTARVEPPRPSLADRALVGLGTLLFATALLMLGGFGIYAMTTDVAVPLIVKIATVMLVLTGVGFAVHALRTRLRAAKHDPYKEIDQ